jgi:hypothetical protein
MKEPRTTPDAAFGKAAAEEIRAHEWRNKQHARINLGLMTDWEGFALFWLVWAGLLGAFLYRLYFGCNSGASVVTVTPPVMAALCR